MADRRSPPQESKKHGFSHHLWISDENGNIYFIKRDQRNPARLVGQRVSAPRDRFEFGSVDELTTKSKIFRQERGKHDRSVAIVKMLLTMGVTAAAIPQGILNPGDGFTLKGTSYVISLASFDKEHAFWPHSAVSRIDLSPSNSDEE